MNVCQSRKNPAGASSARALPEIRNRTVRGATFWTGHKKTQLRPFRRRNTFAILSVLDLALWDGVDRRAAKCLR
jgi:hypothetical protein